MKTTRAVLTAAIAAGLTIGAVGASFAGSKYPNQPRNFAEHQPNGPKYKKKSDLPPGVNCEHGFYGLRNCNVSRNGRTFGPEGYDYAIGTGQHIQR